MKLFFFNSRFSHHDLFEDAVWLSLSTEILSDISRLLLLLLSLIRSVAIRTYYSFYRTQVTNTNIFLFLLFTIQNIVRAYVNLLLLLSSSSKNHRKYRTTKNMPGNWTDDNIFHSLWKMKQYLLWLFYRILISDLILLFISLFRCNSSICDREYINRRKCRSILNMV